MKLLAYIFLALALIPLPACAQRTAARPTAQPIITFIKTPCYGFCPHYEATIYPSGRVTFVGHSYVKMLGTHELHLPAATVARILQTAEKIGFAQLPEVYTKGTSDLPATVLAIRQPNGITKSVRAVEGTPPALQRLLTYITRELDKLSGGPVKE